MEGEIEMTVVMINGNHSFAPHTQRFGFMVDDPVIIYVNLCPAIRQGWLLSCKNRK